MELSILTFFLTIFVILLGESISFFRENVYKIFNWLIGSLGHNYDKYQNGIEQNFPQDGKLSLMKTIKKFASSKQDMIDPLTVSLLFAIIRVWNDCSIRIHSKFQCRKIFRENSLKCNLPSRFHVIFFFRKSAENIWHSVKIKYILCT